MAKDDEHSALRKKTAMNAEMTLDAVMSRAEAVEVLAELYELLEDYGPTWYTEDLHTRAEAALRTLRESH